MTGHPCIVHPAKSSDITIAGNVFAVDANTVLLNGITVRGNVVLIGGGEQAGNPWPIKTNRIGGNLIVYGATPEWLGVVINQIGGSVVLGDVTIAQGEQFMFPTTRSGGISFVGNSHRPYREVSPVRSTSLAV